MNYGDLSCLTINKVSKRLELLHKLVIGYKIRSEKFLNQKVFLRENGIEDVSKFYWMVFDHSVKPYIKNKEGGQVRANRYKICSGLELAIMRMLPLEHEDQKLIKKINADFAFISAKEILQSWGTYNIKIRLDDFNKEHLTWLEFINSYKSFPIFSNAQTLRLYDVCVQIKKAANQSLTDKSLEALIEIEHLLDSR